MSWNERMGIEWLRRIVVLLFSLAECAEETSRRTWLIRRRVLAILRIAETVAFQSVAGAARDFGAPLPAQAVAAGRSWKFDNDYDDPENALRLAQRFRALAVALAHLLAMAEQLAGTTFNAGANGAENTDEARAAFGPGLPALPAAMRRAAIRAPPVVGSPSLA